MGEFILFDLSSLKNEYDTRMSIQSYIGRKKKKKNKFYIPFKQKKKVLHKSNKLEISCDTVHRKKNK